MTEAQVKAMHKEITEFMSKLAVKYSFSDAGSQISYSESSFTLKFKGNIIDQTTGKKVIDKTLINRAARVLWSAGYTEIDAASIFKKDYIFDGIGKGRVVDVRSKAPKYPFVVETVNGAKFAVPVDAVIRSIGFKK